MQNVATAVYYFQEIIQSLDIHPLFINPHLMHADLWLLGNVLGTDSDDADGLHGGIGEGSVAGEL